MSIFNGKGKVGNRRPSLKGKVQYYIRDGGEVAANWPRKRGANVDPATKDRMDWFWQAQFASKYLPARQMVEIMKAVEGTPLLPRDITTMIFAGRCYDFRLTDGRRLYSMAMIIDVSESLDVLGYRQGDVLFRGTKFWERIPIGPAGQVLTSDGQRPLWQEGGGGGSAGGMVSVRPRPFFTWTSGSVYGGNSCGLTAGYAEYEQQISALRAACSQAAAGQLIAPVIYADNNGSPGALIVQGDFVPLIGGDIVTMPLNAPLTLAEGQRVWVGVYVRGAGSCYFYTCGIAFPQRFFAWTNPALPSVAIPTQGGNSNNSTWWCV